MIIHIPHASTQIPRFLRGTLLLSDTELELELLKLTDWYTDELFDIQSAVIVRHSVSRLVVDPERFTEDDDEPSAECGYGATYIKTTTGKPLRSLSDDQRIGLLDQYYHPHHRSLAKAVERELDGQGRALIVDAHSFPDNPLPFEPPTTPSSVRPDICIGTDEFHTPREIIEYLVNTFERLGYTVQIDKPFSGTIVPTQHYKADERVHSVMIEINRRLYLKPNSSKKLENFRRVRSDLHSVLYGLESFTNATGPANS